MHRVDQAIKKFHSIINQTTKHKLKYSTAVPHPGHQDQLTHDTQQAHIETCFAADCFFVGGGGECFRFRCLARRD